MTSEQIFDWCVERLNIPRRDDVYERGEKTVHAVRFENGDSYEHTEEYTDTGRMKKRVETKINGETVRMVNMRWENYGWQEVTA